MTSVNGHQRASGLLRQRLEDAADDTGIAMKDLTVLSEKVDPFRLDTPKNHELGRWLAEALDAFGLTRRVIHIRGIHYAILGHPKPDGRPYTNTFADWSWLEGEVARAARWLDYVPFDQIIDNRNSPPEVQEADISMNGEAYVSTGVYVDIPTDLDPSVGLDGFHRAQPYRLVVVAEKASAQPVLGPLAARHEADLYLPTGCLSNTLAYRIAKDAAGDGRPLRVLYFADCDPAGWNMPIELARKLQAFETVHFPDLEWKVVRAGLTPDQVRTLGLPGTPLKPTEKRADRWQAAMGVEQIELDAIATLRPDVLRQIANTLFGHFYDRGLDSRVRVAARAWTSEAQQAVDEASDTPQMAAVRQQAQEKLAELDEQIQAINDALRVSADGFDLPAIPDLPEPELDWNDEPDGIASSDDDFVDQTQGLIADRNYEV